MKRFPRTSIRRMIIAALAALFALPALAVSGTVRDVDGKPIKGARVCHFQVETGAELYCVETGLLGEFDTVDSGSAKLRAMAPGYFSEVVDARGHQVIVLERTPELLVRLVDAATGEPIERGEVFVIYPSAARKGPFPANRAGVRITRVLQPGEVRLIGQAEGYEPSEPISVELERGEEVEATLELQPQAEGGDGE